MAAIKGSPFLGVIMFDLDWKQRSRHFTEWYQTSWNKTNQVKNLHGQHFSKIQVKEYKKDLSERGRGLLLLGKLEC